MSKVIMFLFLIFLAPFCHSCAGNFNRFHTAYDETGSYRLCNTPELVAIGKDIPYEWDFMIMRTIDYWNKIIGKDVFFYAGRVPWTAYDPEALGTITVGLLDPKKIDFHRARLPSDICGLAHYYVTANGCVHRPKILVQRSCINDNIFKVESILRHEFGHALGFTHSPISTDLMNSNPDSGSHPFEASDEEKDAVRHVYP